MKTSIISGIISVLLGIQALAQTLPQNYSDTNLRPPLDKMVEDFELSDSILREGIAELSSNRIDGLHLGVEEILRENINDDPRTKNPHFSLHLRHKTVREILNALCDSDPRYVWSTDGPSINVYPRASVGDSAYLLNHSIEGIVLTNISDPDHGLTPLVKLFPNEQIGYMGFGDDSYAQPWTTAFEHITVRQLINKLAEHLGSRSVWMWQGSGEERMFTFQRGGFQSRPATDTK